MWFFCLLSPRIEIIDRICKKIKKVIILCFLFFFNLSRVHTSGSSSTSVDFVFCFFFPFLSYFVSSVIIIVLIPSARPIIVKICAIFSIKITFVNGHGETSSSSVLKRSKTNKRNRKTKTKQIKTKTTKTKQKTKQ